VRTTISTILVCVLFLAGNEGIRHAHNRLTAVLLPETYTESSRLHFSDPCRIALLGDSIILTGLDPSLIPESYNFAWLDAQYLANYFVLEWMLRSDPKNLEVIVLPFDRHSFSPRRNESPTMLKKATFVQAFMADHRDEQRGAYLRRWTQDRLFPYSDFPSLLASRSDENQPVLRRGFLGMSGGNIKSPEDFQRSAERRGRQLFRDEAWYDERLGWYFESIIQRATDSGLKVVLVQCPVSHEFDEELRRHVSDETFDEFKADVRAKFPEIEILNARDAFLDRHDLFFDANHLSIAGSKEFSELVRNELERLGVLSP